MKSKKFVNLLVVMGFMLAAAFWSVPLNASATHSNTLSSIVQVSAPWSSTSVTGIATTSSDDGSVITAAWLKLSSAGPNQYEVFASRSTNAGTTWSVPIRLSDVATSSNSAYVSPLISGSSDGSVVTVAWTWTRTNPTRDIRVMRFSNGQWDSAPVVVASPSGSDVNYSIESLKSSSDGSRVALGCQRLDSGYWSYACAVLHRNGIWEPVQDLSDSQNPVGKVFVDMSSDGAVITSGWETTNNSTGASEVTAARNLNGVWGTVVRLSNTFLVARHSILSIKSSVDGSKVVVLFVALNSSINKYELRASIFSNSAWESAPGQLVSQPADEGAGVFNNSYQAAMSATDDLSSIQIAWRVVTTANGQSTTNGTLYGRRFHNNAWGVSPQRISTNVGSSSYRVTGDLPVITQSSDGRHALAAWVETDSLGNREIFVNRFEGSSWDSASPSSISNAVSIGTRATMLLPPLLSNNGDDAVLAWTQYTPASGYSASYGLPYFATMRSGVWSASEGISTSSEELGASARGLYGSWTNGFRLLGPSNASSATFLWSSLSSTASTLEIVSRRLEVPPTVEVSSTVADSSTTTVASTTSSPQLSVTTTSPPTGNESNATTTAPQLVSSSSPSSTGSTTTVASLTSRSTGTDRSKKTSTPSTSSQETDVVVQNSTTTVPSPSAPDVTPIEAAILIDGQKVDSVLARRANSLIVTGAGLEVTIYGQDSAGQRIDLESDGSLRLIDGEKVVVIANGYEANAEVEVWMFSTPTELAVIRTDSVGAFEALLTIPESINYGDHRIILSSTDADGQKVNLGIGVVYGQDNPGSSASRFLLVIPVLVAVFAGIFIPTTLRRRRNLSE